MITDFYEDTDDSIDWPSLCSSRLIMLLEQLDLCIIKKIFFLIAIHNYYCLFACIQPCIVSRICIFCFIMFSVDKLLVSVCV